MEYFHKYRQRLEREGGSIRGNLENSLKNSINNSFNNSPSYSKVNINDGSYKIGVWILNKSSANKNGLNEKKIVSKLQNKIKQGDLIKYGNKYYLLDAMINDIKIYYSGNLTQCNLLPFYFKVNDKTMSSYGFYEKTLTIGVDNQPINLPDDVILVTLPKNENTLKIKSGDEFFIFDDNWYEQYKVSSIDRSKNGLIKLRCKEIQVNSSPDEFYNFSFDDTEKGKYIVIIPNKVVANLDDVINLECKVYDQDDIELIDEIILWESSNVEVATVDEEGNVSAISKGECIIYATLDSDSSTRCECNIEVIDGGSWW